MINDVNTIVTLLTVIVVLLSIVIIALLVFVTMVLIKVKKIADHVDATTKNFARVTEWFNPAKEREAAMSLMDSGADVLAFHTGSTAVMKAAEERGKWQPLADLTLEAAE